MSCQVLERLSNLKSQMKAFTVKESNYKKYDFEVAHPKKCLFVYVPFLVELEFGIFFFRGKGKAEEILTSPSKGDRVINNLNACMTSTPGFEPSPHLWEESALTPSFSFWFLFVLSSVSFLFFSSLFLEIGRNAS